MDSVLQEQPGSTGRFLPALARAGAIALLIGMGFAMLAKVMGLEDLRVLVAANRVGGAEAREALLHSMVYGGLGAACVTLVLFGVGLWRRWAPRTLQQWHVLVAPMMLAPLVYVFFQHEAWEGRGSMLYPTLVLFMLVLEGMLRGSFGAAAELLGGGWSRLREKVPSVWATRNFWWFVVVGAAVFYAYFFSKYSLIAHHSLKTHNFDLSINTNLMHTALHGRFMESPVAFGDEPTRYLAAHIKLGVYLFLPVYALFPSAKTMLVLQSVMLGATAIPLFGFARHRVPDWIAAFVALGFLAYHPVHSANFFEMKWLTIAAFFIPATLWAAEAKKWVWFVVLALMGMLIRDDTPIGYAVIGLVMLLSGHRPKAGIFLMVTGLGAFLFMRGVLMEDRGEWWFPSMYKGLWSDGEKGFGSVIRTLLSNPLYSVKTLFKEDKLHYFLQIFLPVAFLPLRRPLLWLIMIPGMLTTLLTTGYKPTITQSFHYVMHWAPYVFVGSAITLGALWHRNGQAGRLKAAAGVVTAMFLCAQMSYMYGAFTKRKGGVRGGYTRIDFEWSDKDRTRYRQLMSLAKMIPPEASVSATERVGPHVAARSEIYAIRLRWGKQMGEYVLVSKRELKLEKTTPRLQEILRRGTHGVLARKGEFALLKRGHDTKQNQRLLRDWRL